MKHKAPFFGSIAMVVVAGSIALIDHFVIDLPDIATVVAGIFMMVGMVIIVYSTARTLLHKKTFVYKNQESMEQILSFYDRSLASLQVDIEEEYVQTSFGKTHVVYAGDRTKKPLFTLHGGNGIAPLNIRLFLPLLSDYCLISPDVIGMPGKSEPFRNLSTKGDDYGTWITEILDALQIDRVMFVVSSYSCAMMLSLAKVHPDRISKAVLLVPSGIAHGPMHKIMWDMAIPFMKYYFRPSRKALQGIMDTMVSEGDDMWREFLDLMMTCYKMEMRPPREFTKAELSGFNSPILLIASSEDVFFPDNKVFPRADQIFPGPIRKMRISGKHLPSARTMADVCKAIVAFDAEHK